MTTKPKIIVALHGAGAHAGVWGALMGGLDLPCDPLTLPGHGPAGGALLASIEDMGAWLSARLDEYEGHDVVVIGHSMGALVALEAAQHPAVCALVLLGAAAEMPVHDELLFQAAENPAMATDMVLKWGVSPVHPQAADVRLLLKTQMADAGAAALLNDLRACNDYRNGARRAATVPVQALVLAGLDDKLAKPSAAQALAEMMPDAQFDILPDCGHMPMIEKPAETADKINSFIALLAG